MIIELGTVFSKVAYKYASSSNLSLKLWSADELIRLDYIPTSILIQPDCKTVEGFGYEAETKYNVLKANKNESEYFYFKGLKDLISLKRVCISSFPLFIMISKSCVMSQILYELS